jgi:hypothetical protein
MKENGTQTTAFSQKVMAVGENDLKDILKATVDLVEPTQENATRLFFTVYGISHHEGSIPKLTYDGRIDTGKEIYYQLSLTCVFTGGMAQETSFISTFLFPPETDLDRKTVLEARVEAKVIVLITPDPSSRTVVKPVPLPHPR